MVSIIITLIICGTVAYLGYLGHKEREEEHRSEQPKTRQFVSIDEALKQPEQPEYRAE